MIHTASVMTARQNMDLFQKIRCMKEMFEQLSTDLASAYHTVDTAAAEAEIAEALQKQ